MMEQVREAPKPKKKKGLQPQIYKIPGEKRVTTSNLPAAGSVFFTENYEKKVTKDQYYASFFSSVLVDRNGRDQRVPNSMRD